MTKEGLQRECYKIKSQDGYGVIREMIVSVMVDFPDATDGFGKAIEFAKEKFTNSVIGWTIISVERLFSFDDSAVMI
jgi:hypothetical protein